MNFGEKNSEILNSRHFHEWNSSKENVPNDDNFYLQTDLNENSFLNEETAQKPLKLWSERELITEYTFLKADWLKNQQIDSMPHSKIKLKQKKQTKVKFIYTTKEFSFCDEKEQI